MSGVRADAGDADHRRLPEVLVHHLRPRRVECLAQARREGADDLALLLERCAVRHLERDRECPNDHQRTNATRRACGILTNPMATQTAPQATPADAGRGATVVELFRHQVAARGPAKALHFRSGDRYTVISWEEFGRAARRWSAYLLSQGVAEQEHVAIWAGNRPEWHIGGHRHPVAARPSRSRLHHAER